MKTNLMKFKFAFVAALTGADNDDRTTERRRGCGSSSE
jgi:hypothetical protein